MAERLILAQKVEGSKPSAPAIFYRGDTVLKQVEDALKEVLDAKTLSRGHVMNLLLSASLIAKFPAVHIDELDAMVDRVVERANKSRK